MEVTTSNFKSILSTVEKALKDCTFISIDCELTGLNLAYNINAYDTPEEYYQKVRTNCKEFLVIQYGISVFRYDAKKDLFKQQSYNFYIFRKPNNKHIEDQRFLCQTSSINFLINQGFDFNKLFKEGIPYLNLMEEEKYRYNLEESYKRKIDIAQSQQNGNDMIVIPENAQQFIDDVVKQIEEFLENDNHELQLPKCNAFYRKLIYQIKSEKFPNKISIETRHLDNADRILFVTKLKDGEEEEKCERKRYEEQLSDLEDFVGFTKILRMIVNSDKLVVGHNVCLDFLHTINKFFAPLPEDYNEFKELAHSLFSKVIDTKYMSSLEPFKDLISSNVLKHLLDTVLEKPFEIPKIGIEDGCQGYSIEDNKVHEAGYDAYITGLSFLSMWKYLGTRNALENKNLYGNFDLLKPFINKIFLMTLADNQYINLAGEDLAPSRDHVFYLTFPKDWKMNNIVQLFSPFGNVYISWLNDTSAYVSLYKKDQAAMALSILSQNDTYTIMTFAKRQALLSGTSTISTPLSSPLIPKKRKSSDGPPSVKKRRTDSFNSSGFSTSKRSIDPIEEEQTEVEDSYLQKKSKKMFVEDDSWE